MQPRITTLLAALLAAAACSPGRPPDDRRDSVLATPVSATPPLAHDSVVTWPADTGVRVGSDGRPRFPIVFASSCEGEDCETSFKGLACEPVELRSAADTAAPVVARIARGDSVHVTRTDLHVVRPGIVVVKQPIVRATEPDMEDDHPMPRKDTLRIAARDTVWLLRYEQLGWWLYWWNGKTTDGGQFWGAPADVDALGVVSHDTLRAVARSQPVTESWWLLDDGTRPLGWWRTDSLASLRSVYNMEHWDEHCTTGPSAARRASQNSSSASDTMIPAGPRM